MIHPLDCTPAQARELVAVAASRVYTVALPPGMLTGDQRMRRFDTEAATEDYLSELKRAGYTVTAIGTHDHQVERPSQPDAARRRSDAYYFTPDRSVHARRLLLLQRSVKYLSARVARHPDAARALADDQFELRATAGWLIAQGCESRFSAVRSPGCFCQAGVVAPPDSLMCETTGISAGDC